MDWMINFLIGFLLLVLTEGIVKPLIRYFVNQKVRQYGPAVFDFLDKNMPELLMQYSGKQLEEAVRYKLQDVSGLPVTKSDLNKLFKIYDPRITADRHPHYK